MGAKVRMVRVGVGAWLVPMACHVAQHAQHEMPRAPHAIPTPSQAFPLALLLVTQLHPTQSGGGATKRRVCQPSGWGDVVRGGPPTRV